jgi:hypothetical protein
MRPFIPGTITKFNRYHVVQGPLKASVFYHLDNRGDGRACVTLYARKYQNCLGQIFKEEFVDNTDITTDYFEKGKVVLFADHPLYPAARCRAELIREQQRVGR